MQQELSKYAGETRATKLDATCRLIAGRCTPTCRTSKPSAQSHFSTLQAASFSETVRRLEESLTSQPGIFCTTIRASDRRRAIFWSELGQGVTAQDTGRFY